MEGADESIEGLLVGIVVGFPGAEIGDEVFADFDGGVFADFGVEAFPFFEWLKTDQADREQHTAFVGDFAFTGFSDFGFDPLAVHAVFGEDEEELIVEADGFVDLFVDFSRAQCREGEGENPDGGVIAVGVT